MLYHLFEYLKEFVDFPGIGCVFELDTQASRGLIEVHRKTQKLDDSGSCENDVLDDAVDLIDVRIFHQDVLKVRNANIEIEKPLSQERTKALLKMLSYGVVTRSELKISVFDF